MEIVQVILATVAAFAAGAVWYMKLSKPWLEATGIPVGPDGKPEGGNNPAPFIIGFFLQLVVAGMMRHVFSLAGIDTLGEGIVAGLGIGLFFITPWIGLNNVYSMRPWKLTLIDGGYATLACAIMGLVLTIF
ncbi:DUF1761 domain-containing protein [Tropicibacter oceani]|uniref:DUF1761 domain-containing protein n=1 Tax=Tropicibacter oceani TaxID=3058420 RepID=A0ABY8QK78_9RHOB|nr:DUF1761 domain-containing protein [Tropicibacter oceani]WGW04547.1 DUF1761 domain-containing protein [Tropicibacter oceani]